MKTKKIQEILEVIQRNDSFILTTHISPDGDALGSIIALGLSLKKLNKKVTYYIDPSLGDKYLFLPEIKNILNPRVKDKKYPVSISLDCSSTDYLYEDDILNSSEITINIDHHKNNKEYGNINLIDSEAGATGEIVYEVIEALDAQLDVDIATALYTAIVTDTGNFKYSNTTSKTHYIVSELLKFPIFPEKINKVLFDEHSINKILLIGKVINNLKVSLNGKLAVITITQEDLEATGATNDDIEGMINIGRDIRGVEVAVLLKEVTPNKFKVNFRSNEYIDVADMAFKFGGGGHSRAAGCVMTGEKDEILTILKNIILEKL